MMLLWILKHYRETTYQRFVTSNLRILKFIHFTINTDATFLVPPCFLVNFETTSMRAFTNKRAFSIQIEVIYVKILTSEMS